MKAKKASKASDLSDIGSLSQVRPSAGKHVELVFSNNVVVRLLPVGFDRESATEARDFVAAFLSDNLNVSEPSSVDPE